MFSFSFKTVIVTSTWLDESLPLPSAALILSVNSHSDSKSNGRLRDRVVEPVSGLTRDRVNGFSNIGPRINW